MVKTQKKLFADRSKLLKRDRERLVNAYVEGKSEVMLIVASLPGTNEAVARSITDLGGIVRYRADDVDYLRVKVPIRRVTQITRLADIQVISLDGSTAYSTSSFRAAVNTGGVPQATVEPPGPNTSAENPYLPTRDIGAPQFVAKHPTFDGRGVAIGDFDFGLPYVLCPELQTATTLEGKPTRKLAALLNALDPVDDDNVPEMVKMPDEVFASAGRFSYRNGIYIAPADRRYRIGFFDRRALNGIAVNPPGSSKQFAVLWDESMNTVWVDTNQNNSFTDEKAMTDYNVRHDIGVFGKVNQIPSVEALTFVVLTDQQSHSVYVVPQVYVHTTGTASIATGKGFFRGRMNGVAPGAQIVSILKSYTYHGLIEGMIAEMKYPTVDIVTEQHSSVERLNDGNSTISVIWDRLIERYKKPVFGGIANEGPGVNTVLEITSGSRIITVGGYIHKDTWHSNFGVSAAKDDYVMNLSSRGPSEDGGFKPDVIAPVAPVIAIEPYPDYDTRLKVWRTIGGGGTYSLPPGYFINTGTSWATPMVSGTAALLISAAKQSHVPYDADKLRWAIKSSARYLPSYRALDQGNGLVQVEAAWEALKSAPPPVAMTSRAPVNTILSQYLKEPNWGRGVYEREGWAAGQTSKRAITFIRSSGLAGSVTYAVRWLGNDGTFGSPEAISVPLNVPTILPVTISPKSTGVHSAILQLIDLLRPNVVYETMNTVVAAEQFTASNGFTVFREGQAEYPSYTSYFFNVPTETSALKFDLNIAGGNVRVLFMDPSGTEYGMLLNVAGGGYPTPFTFTAPYQTGSRSRTIANPEAGVWEVIVDNGNFRSDGPRSTLDARASFTFRASVLGVKTDAPDLIVGSSREGGIHLDEVNFSNHLSAFIGGINENSLGSAFADRPTLKEGGTPQIYEIDVPLGAETLGANIGAPSDNSADLDLYLYDCSGKGCELKDFSIGSGAQETVSVTNPNPGKWKVVIDPSAVPSGTMTCEYRDIFTHPAFGKLKSAGGPSEHVTGSKWVGKVRVHVDAVPLAPRYLAGLLEVSSENDDTIGYTRNANHDPEYSPMQRPVQLGTALVEVEASATKGALPQFPHK